MTIILSITATTTNDAIDSAIPLLDMRASARESRDYAIAVGTPSDVTVLELHDKDGVLTLCGPDFDYLVANGVAIDHRYSLGVAEAKLQEHAARLWRGFKTYHVIFAGGTVEFAIRDITSCCDGEWYCAIQRFNGEHDMVYITVPKENAKHLEAILKYDHDVISYKEHNT